LDSLMRGEGKKFFNKRRVFTLIMIQLWLNSYKVEF
jgi:hypothetical protein